jgi:MFS superfamily sulfate permease-like transporter
VRPGHGGLLCGALGVLPVSGVIVRSSANVLAGGRTRLSTILHGVWILLFVTLLPGLLSQIPVSALAAVLVYTGLKLTKLHIAKILWRQDRAEAGIYAATLGTVVMVDLLTGIAVGIGLALVRLLYSFSRLEVKLVEDKVRGRVDIHLRGAATFIRLPMLAAVLEKVPSGAAARLCCRDLTYIDHACLDLLANWEQGHQAAGGKLVIDWKKLRAVFQKHAWNSRSPKARLAEA